MHSSGTTVDLFVSFKLRDINKTSTNDGNYSNDINVHLDGDTFKRQGH